MDNTTDLKYKKRTITDLVRFIKNASSQVDDKVGSPNFSLLLGAGASVSSGIKSGGDLINQWRSEIYEEECENQTQQSPAEFFNQARTAWFDENNAYSSLFEHRYDLQRQRRIFVEKQVAGKSPSIGYAYLVSLIDNGFFNTIFTTNFDDLLNEAFYRFSSSRPIVCAHDSSISGVTITSKRPKIIKLHGDYLFDNIKTTLRETESLEQNMRQKFQEFAKDYGLIVIGYSGKDRSIMDILTYLLQHDEYFKNGVYWCLRPGEIDSVGGELKKLFWKERVYYVEIDGFDELLAELNHKLMNGTLPIGDDFMTRNHQEKIIQELTENKNIENSQSEYLKNDCRRLKQRLAEGKMRDILQFAKENNAKKVDKYPKHHPILKPQQSSLTIEEKQNLDDLQETLLLLHNRPMVIQKIKALNVLQLPDNQYKIELLELLVDASKNLSDEQIRTYYNELIRLNPNNQVYYRIAANRSLQFDQKKEYWQMAISAFPNDYYVYNRYADIMLDYLEEHIDFQDISSDLPCVFDAIDKSLKLNHSISNEAHRFWVRYWDMQDRNNRDEWNSKIAEKYNELKIICQYHPTTLYVVKSLKGNAYDENIIREAVTYYKKADQPNLLEECYEMLIDYLIKNKGIEATLPVFVEYESLYEPSDSYTWKKAQILRNYEFFCDALKLFDKLDETRELIDLKLNTMFILQKEEEAETYFNSVYKTPQMECDYLQLKGDYVTALEIYKNEIFDSNNVSEAQLMTYSYLLLQNTQYNQVEQLLKPYYDNPLTASASIILNYLFARQQNKKNVDDKVKEKILNNKYKEFDNLEKAAAYALLHQKSEMIKSLKGAIKERPIEKYNVINWPIMAQYKEDPEFLKIVAPSLRKLD